MKTALSTGPVHGRSCGAREESGHVQNIKEIRLDCDRDVFILVVEQVGGIACHTGRESCFYRVLEDGQWKTVDKVLKDPEEIY